MIYPSIALILSVVLLTISMKKKNNTLRNLAIFMIIVSVIAFSSTVALT